MGTNVANKVASWVMGSLKVGDVMPEAHLDNSFPPEKVSVANLCKGRKVVFIGMEGAFTPVCSSKHVPSYLEKEAELKARGIDEVAVISINDSAVMDAWAQSLKVPGDSFVHFYGDPKGELTRALGVVADDEKIMKKFSQPRCRRFSLLADDGKITVMEVEGQAKDGGHTTVEDTFADRMLEKCGDAPPASMAGKLSGMARSMVPGTAQTVMGHVKVGGVIPEATLDRGFPPEKVPVSQLCKGRKIVLVGITGAFTPVCTTKHVPSYAAKEAELKAKGIDEVIVYSVNDCAVMDAWAKSLGLAESPFIHFYGDPAMHLTKALGVTLDTDTIIKMLGSPRCKRFSMLVHDGKIRAVNVAGDAHEGGAPVTDEDTFADRILQQC